MRRPSTEPRNDLRRLRRRVLACLAAVVAASCSASERPALFPSPPVVAVAEVSEHTGQVVRVQGTVVAATATQGRAILDLDGAAGSGLRIVIAPPLLGPRPAELVERFQGQEVVAEGPIDDLGDRLEMLVGDPGSVRVASAAAATSEVARVVPPPPASAPAPVEPPARPAAQDREDSAPRRAVSAPARDAPSTAAPAAAAAVTPGSVPRAAPEAAGIAAPAAAPAGAPAPAVATGAEAISDACERARHRWRLASEAARAPLAQLERCLGKAGPSCRQEVEALREALAEVAAAEERVDWLCPEAR